MISTDHHAFSSETSGSPGKASARENESIMAGGVSYVKVKGAWRKSPLTLAELREQKVENRKTAKNVSCHYLRDEAVNGESAQVYSAHSENEDEKSDLTIWVSKARGLPLRQEQDIDVGGAGGKTHYSLRYDYRNVSAPPVS
jgi:hypothetical protein